MKKVLFIFLCVFLCALTLFSLLFLPLPVKKGEDKGGDHLQIWHLDIFEGGTGSRLNCLKKIASEYMKKTGVLTIVSSHTIYSAEQNFKKGIYPDIISYSNGLDLPYDKLLSTPFLGKREYAIPWCAGGYLLIKRKSVEVDGLIISKQEYTLPILAVVLSKIETPVKKIIDSDKAVNEFYANKNFALVGTQRDLFRLENKGVEVEVRALSGYNDIYQYASLVCESKKYQTAVEFLNFLLYKCENSNILSSIGMLPNKGFSADICNEILKDFAGVEYEYGTQPLISRAQINALQKQAENYQNEEESIKNALKRLK